MRPEHKKARRGDAERAARKPPAKAPAPPVEMRRAASKARYAASPQRSRDGSAVCGVREGPRTLRPLQPL